MFFCRFRSSSVVVVTDLVVFDDGDDDLVVVVVVFALAKHVWMSMFHSSFDRVNVYWF